jgi:Lon-like protease
MAVALFTDGGSSRRQPPRRRIGRVLLTIAIVGTLAFSLVPSPYVIEQPGPVFNTLGTVERTDSAVPMISIPTERTFKTDGTLDMLTVDFVGNREQLPNWFQVISAWIDPSRAVVPVDAVYPVGYSLEDSARDSAIDMANSQKEAIAAALRELGYDVPGTVTVTGFSPESPSLGALKNGDKIIDVAGEDIEDVSGLRAAIAKAGTERPLSIGVERDGKRETESVVPVLSGGENPVPIIGILSSVDYALPFEVKIQLDHVGGPSAGSMFALGIIDKLTPGALTGGQKVAGTGTIDANGSIGQIGGIRQKLFGAVNAGAKWFLAPAGNCRDIVGHVPDGLEVFAVQDLDDALNAMQDIRAGKRVAGEFSCPA